MPGCVRDAGVAQAPVAAGVRVRPNPARRIARVTLAVADPATRVRIAVYDAGGRRVRDVRDGVLDAGTYGLRWDGDDTAGRRVRPGLYFVRWSVGPHAGVERVLLLD